MKKTAMAIAAGMMLFTFSSCGQEKDFEDTPTDNMGGLVGSAKEERPSVTGKAGADLYGGVSPDYDGNEPSLEIEKKDDGQIEKEDGLREKEDGFGKGEEKEDGLKEENDVLENLIGEYAYLSDYGAGKLVIKKTSYGYDIADYESEASYRFLADSSNIETIENNRIYIKYPEQVLSDDTVLFGYYILEYSGNEIDVYYGRGVPEDAEFLYRAMKVGGIIDYEALGIQEYEYPSEFVMGDNLKTAITQLAISYGDFDKTSVASEYWKEIFVAKFIQNTRLTFDYLDRIGGKRDGWISADELNYIHASLTGIELDFSSYGGGAVNRYDAASAYNFGSISGYVYEDTEDGVMVTAGLEIGFDGTDTTQERELMVELVKNPYSCFDGYSIVSIVSKAIGTDLEP